MGDDDDDDDDDDDLHQLNLDHYEELEMNS